MFFLVVPFCYASLHNDKKHKQRGETLQIIIEQLTKNFKLTSIFYLLVGFINIYVFI